VVERATGRRYADLISELIWRPMGAARSAYITVDRLGAPRAAGGICATVRDLALVGQLIANAGTRGGKQVLPRAWLDDIAARGDLQAWSAGDFVRISRAPGIAANDASMTATDRCCSTSAFIDNTCSSTPHGSWLSPRCRPKSLRSTLRA